MSRDAQLVRQTSMNASGLSDAAAATISRAATVGSGTFST